MPAADIIHIDGTNVQKAFCGQGMEPGERGRGSAWDFITCQACLQKTIDDSKNHWAMLQLEKLRDKWRQAP